MHTTTLETPKGEAPFSVETSFFIFRLAQILALTEVKFMSTAPTDDLITICSQCGVFPTPDTRSQALKAILKIAPIVLAYVGGAPTAYRSDYFNKWLSAVQRDDREEACKQLFMLNLN